jgi:hypothetical protein
VHYTSAQLEQLLAKWREHRTEFRLSPAQLDALLATDLVSDDERDSLRAERDAIIPPKVNGPAPLTATEAEYLGERGLLEEDEPR